MRKITILVGYVILSICSLNAFPKLCKHLYELNKSENYPLYELVDEHQMVDSEKILYKRKRQKINSEALMSFSFSEDAKTNPQTGRNETYITLRDENGNELWSKSKNGKFIERGFTLARNGISVMRDFDRGASLTWIDKQGNKVNSFPLEKYMSSYVTALKNGNLWMVNSRFDSDEIPASYVENPDQSKLFFFDSLGNMLNQIDLKYKFLYDELEYNEYRNRIVVTCYEELQNYTRKYYSYFLDTNGNIIKEYEDIAVAKGRFSEDGSYYLVDNRTDFIIDTDTGEILTTYRTNEPSAISNKSANILALFESGTLRIISLDTKEILFSKFFELPVPSYIEISGEGSIITFIIGNTFHKYKQKFHLSK